MGNSEVGHLNLGAGAVVKQDITRIDDAVEDGSFLENEALRDAHVAAREGAAACTCSAWCRPAACTRAWSTCARSSSWPGARACPTSCIHAFTDGRDTSPDSGAGYLAEVDGWEGARVATVTRPLLRHGPRPPLGPHQARLGRARARADRTSRAPTRARPPCAPPTSAARPTSSSSRRSWGRRGASATATPSSSSTSAPTAPASSSRALGEDGFAEFDRGERPRVSLTTLTSYQEDWDYPVAFPPARPARHAGLGARRARHRPAARGGDREVRARDVLLQRRRGEPVRGRGAPARGLAARRGHLRREARDVAREAAADAFVERWAAGDYGFGVINFANPDMVGHTGDIPAARARHRDGGRLPRPGAWRRCTPRAAPASSPPTTATRTTCSSRTAARTPPTR